MKNLLWFCALCVNCTIFAAELVSITGTVKVHDPSNKLDSSNVVVFLNGSQVPHKEDLKTLLITQKNKTFQPAVTSITAGQTVQFQNLDDDTMHNVFSASGGNAFDLGLAPKNEKREVVFEKPGLVDVYCNIHPDMVANVMVLPNSNHTITDSEGNFEIKNITPGKYTIHAWHRLAEINKKEITVASGENHKIFLDLNITKTLSPHLDKRGKSYRAKKY